ncbi:RNA-binding protein, partial [Emiliania huxleyi CCMP1516]|uniref:RRM domain-containing protein n=2 Tax=Emiliania huxleyi TaxID=2903 RepID=A0A0D3J0V4_EMIH1
VFVGGLASSTTSEDVKKAFAKCGRVTDCYLPTDRETGDARGFAFVTFEVMSEAEEAIAKMDGAELDGRMLKAVQAPDR